MTAEALFVFSLCLLLLAAYMGESKPQKSSSMKLAKILWVILALMVFYLAAYWLIQ